MTISEQIMCRIPARDALEEIIVRCSNPAPVIDLGDWGGIFGAVAAIGGAVAATIAAVMAARAWKTARKHLEHTQHADHMTRVYGSTADLIGSLQALNRRAEVIESEIEYRRLRDETYTVAVIYRLTAAPHLDFETWRGLVRWMLELAGLRHKYLATQSASDHHHDLARGGAHAFVQQLTKYAETESERVGMRENDPQYDLNGRLRQELLRVVKTHGIAGDPDVIRIQEKLGSLDENSLQETPEYSPNA